MKFYCDKCGERMDLSIKNIVDYDGAVYHGNYCLTLIFECQSCQTRYTVDFLDAEIKRVRRDIEMKLEYSDIPSLDGESCEEHTYEPADGAAMKALVELMSDRLGENVSEKLITFLADDLDMTDTLRDYFEDELKEAFREDAVAECHEAVLDYAATCRITDQDVHGAVRM